MALRLTLALNLLKKVVGGILGAGEEGLLLEDNTSFILLEDDASVLLLE
jgi:hypothetical protein